MLNIKNRKIWIFFAILPALFFQAVGTYFYYVYSGAQFPQAIYVVTKILLIVWPLLCWALIGKFLFIESEKNNKRSFLFGLASGLIFLAAILGVYFSWQDYFQQYAYLIKEKVENLGISGVKFLVFAVFLSLIHSFIEEYYWRSFVFRGLLGLVKFWPAMIIAGAGFALHHYLLLSQFFPWPIVVLFGTIVGAAGAWWSWVYSKTNSLLGAWISHVFSDLAVMIVAYFLIF
jgi:membrane protease YdiL (CAAX protease family)